VTHAEGRVQVSAGDGDASWRIAARPADSIRVAAAARPGGRLAANPAAAASRAQVAAAPTPTLPPTTAASEARYARRDAAPRTAFAAGDWPALHDEPHASAATRWPSLPDDEETPRASGEFAYDRANWLRAEQRGQPWSG
jgi:hypothetical protein